VLRILEILTSEPSPIVRMAHDQQRTHLMAQGEVTTLDLRGKSTLDKVALLDAVKTPNAIILRGFTDFYRVATRFPNVRMIVDCCGRIDLPSTVEGRFHLTRVAVLCYSELMEAKLRKLGASDVTVLPGPILGYLAEPQELTGPVRIGFVPGQFTRHALRDALKIREEKGELWEPTVFISTEKFVGVEQVGSVEEIVETSEVLVGALEAEDLGEPSDAAILAATFGKGLIAVNTEAAEKIGFVGNTFARVAKYTSGAYGAAVRVYLEHRKTMGRGVKTPNPDAAYDTIMEKLRGH